jgi:preprotein translocase subunit SecG
MTLLFLILIIIASVVLGLIVLVQNPKGGGLSGSIAGFSTQFMGVKQTTDVLEKGTWIFAAIIGILCLFSSFFISGTGTNSRAKELNPNAAQQSPVPVGSEQPAPVFDPNAQPAAPDSK